MRNPLHALMRRFRPRIDAHVVRQYHLDAHRQFRILAIQEEDPRIARFYEAQARDHRRLAGPVSHPTTIDH